MANSNDRSVYRRPDGTWVNKRNQAARPASVHPTRQAAERAARRMLQNSGGGELSTHGRNGQIRSKDTIRPGRDPESIKDTER